MPSEPEANSGTTAARRRERWLEYREQQARKGKDAGQDKGSEAIPGRQKGRDTPDDDFSL